MIQVNKQHRGKRWRRRVMVSASLLAVLALLAYLFVLPAIVRSRIRAALHDAGIDHATFDLRSMTPWRARLANISVGDPNWLDVDSLIVRYSLFSLWQGRVHAV